MIPLKDLFLLDPAVHFLNHGSFGATPRIVFEAYQDWQCRLERQPVLLLGREFMALDQRARNVLGKYLNSDASDLIFIPNATHGVNIVARSLALEPGDEVLTTDHEYGACDNTWEFICGKRGANYIHQPIPLPVTSSTNIVEQFWQGVTPQTKVIYLSHISSPTAIHFPVEEICSRARAAGILTLIDGAHAPGQITVDLDSIGADFYTGNCHKWMLSPKGAAFLYTRKEAQPLIEPLVVSWGYSANEATTAGSQYLDYFQWTGTRDPSASLSVPAAIQFMEDYHWEEVRKNCNELLSLALLRIDNLTQLGPIYPDNTNYHQMAAARLPGNIDLAKLKDRLYDEFRVEVPLIEWNNRKLIRISVQGYNTLQDIDVLTEALEKLLPQV
jgi:isopenicillin-N epimerase